MKHFIVFFHILSYTIGFIATTLSFTGYLKFRNRTIIYYLLFMLSMTALLLQQTVTAYGLINFIDNIYLEYLLQTAEAISCGLMIYSLPQFTHSLVGRELSGGRKYIFKILSLMTPIAVIPYCITSYKSIIGAAMNTLLFSVVAYSIFVMIRGMEGISNSEVGKAARIYKWISLIFVPYMFLDARTDLFPALNEFFPYGLLSIPAFYLVWNLVSLYYYIRYLARSTEPAGEETMGKVSEDSTARDESEEEFYERYGITAREKEVIELLAKGYSYNRISEELVVSLPTVKTHVHNIYQKTGVTNKVSLINLMKNKENSLE